MEAEPRGLGRGRRRLIALTVGALVAVIGAEITYRVTRVDALSPTTHPGYVVYHPELGWSYRPGARSRHRSEEFDVEININSRGFRGPEWPAKQAGRKRVLVLGDSLAFGWGVPEDATFSARLAESEPTWDVLNAAVSGYGTDQELLLLRSLQDELEPDLVLCLFCSNDLFECSGPLAYGRHKPYFVVGENELELRGSPVPRPFLERVSLLWRALAKVRWRRAHADRIPDSRADWKRVRALYLAMEEELGEVPLLILSEHKQLDRLSGRGGLHHLDLQPTLKELGVRGRFPVDGHLTEAGHEALARAVRQRAGELVR